MDDLFKSMYQGLENGEKTASSVDIGTLYGVETLEMIQKKISDATGMAFVTVDYRGEPVTELTSFSSFCHVMRSNGDETKLCKASDAFGAVQAAVFQRTYLYFCPCGLLEVAIPIIVRGQYLGGFIGGQMRCYDAPEDIVHLSTVMPRRTNPQDDDELKKLYNQVPKMTYKQFVNFTELISMIINQLGEINMVNLAQKASMNEREKLLSEKERRIELEDSLKEAELVALRSQINPYFIVSTLTSISNLAILENAPQTNEIITMFAGYLRDNCTDSSEKSYVSDEIDAIDRYLHIQKVRYGDKMSYGINVSDELLAQRIPCLLVFPFVERAVYYGVACSENNVEIFVSIEYEADYVQITVEDNGPGYNEKDLARRYRQYKQEHEGASIDESVENAKRRLQMYFGEDYEISILPRPGKGTISRIRYPKSYEEKA